MTADWHREMTCSLDDSLCLLKKIVAVYILEKISYLCVLAINRRIILYNNKNIFDYTLQYPASSAIRVWVWACA